MSEPAIFAVAATVVIFTVASVVAAVTVAVVVTANTVAVAVVTAVIVDATGIKTVSIATAIVTATTITSAAAVDSASALAAAVAAAAVVDQFSLAHLSSCLCLAVVQGLDKLAVLDTRGKCIVNSLFLNRPTQQYCGNSHESKVLANHCWISQNFFLCFGRSGPSEIFSTKSGFCLSHKQKLRQKLTLPNKGKNIQIFACWYITYIQQNKNKKKKGRISFCWLEGSASVMDMPDVQQLRSKFTPEVLRQIIWAIIDDARSFFNTVLTEQFDGQGLLLFPQSFLADMLENICSCNPIQQGNFPNEWLAQPRQERTGMQSRTQANAGGTKTSTGSGGAHGTGVTGGGGRGLETGRQGVGESPQKQEFEGWGVPTLGGGPLGRKGDWRWTPPTPDPHHPKIAALMNPYLAMTHGKLLLPALLDAGNICLENLPMLEKYRNKTTGCSTICWTHVLGPCFYADCYLRSQGGHPTKTDYKDQFADQVVLVLGPAVSTRMMILSKGTGEKRVKPEPGRSAWQQATNGDARGIACMGRRSHHRGVQDNLGKLMDQLETKIKNNYSLKANIIGPMCAMAIQLERRKQAEAGRCKKLKRLPAGKELEIHRVLQESEDIEFNSKLLYDGQGEHGNCSLSTFLDTYTLNDHAREPAMTSTVPQVATTSRSGPAHKGNHKEGKPVVPTHSSTHHEADRQDAGEISPTTETGTNHKDGPEEAGENRLGLQQPCLQSTGDAITGANKNK